MVIINDEDIGKDRETLLLDLIYEATGLRIPNVVISFGDPVEMDTRPDLRLDHNTFIPARVRQEYDYRFGPQSGFLYRRRSFDEYFEDNDITLNLQPTKFPFTIHEIWREQVEPLLPFPVAMEDIVDYEIDDPNTMVLEFKANPKSWIWYGRSSQLVNINPALYKLAPITTFLPGFLAYQAP